jgi:hypothetical protein
VAERIVGEMTPVDARIETYNLCFEKTEEQVKEYRADPAGFMRRLLEQQGHKVNWIQFIRANDRPYSGRQEAGGNGSIATTTSSTLTLKPLAGSAAAPDLRSDPPKSEPESSTASSCLDASAATRRPLLMENYARAHERVARTPV